MRHHWTIALLTVALLLSAAFAASPPVKVQARPGSTYMVLFDPSKMATVEGTIERIYVVPSAKVWLTAVNVTLRTGQGELKVEMGPSWFLDNQELHLKVDDRVTITGSQIKNNGVESLIATEVRRNNEVLMLRATDGMPVWVGWRWTQQPAGASR
jgi:hypothetical protein